MWNIIIISNIEPNPQLNAWLDETTIRNIRLGRRKQIEQWVIIEKIIE
mgnify:CR=1 FL=1